MNAYFDNQYYNTQPHASEKHPEQGHQWEEFHLQILRLNLSSTGRSLSDPQFLLPCEESCLSGPVHAIVHDIAEGRSFGEYITHRLLLVQVDHTEIANVLLVERVYDPLEYIVQVYVKSKWFEL